MLEVKGYDGCAMGGGGNLPMEGMVGYFWLGYALQRRQRDGSVYG